MTYDTAGNPINELPGFCDCGLTGGCSKCNPFKEFWEEDIKMAEMGMDEYNEIILREEQFLNPDLKEFYRKKGYKMPNEEKED